MESTKDKWQLFKYKKHLDSLWEEYETSRENRDVMIQFEHFTSFIKNYKETITLLCQKAKENSEGEKTVCRNEIFERLPFESSFTYTDKLIEELVNKCHIFGIKIPQILDLILLFLNIPK